MNNQFAEVSFKGKLLTVPAAFVDGRTIVTTQKLVKVAEIHDEHWQAVGVQDPEMMIKGLKHQKFKADIFSFAQKLPHTKPQFDYPMEWNNVAAIPITTHTEWWEKRVPQETRKNVRRAAKRGVEVRSVKFDTFLVHSIKSIYDEAPIRQGRRFWHYGKDLSAIEKENGTYRDRCDFIGAFHNGELIGFLKMVHVGKVASIMQIICKNAHYDKRPTNALLAKAVEICGERGMSHFIYGQYTYGNNNDASLTEFKRRNGFEEILLPRYYVPLTAWGHVCINTRLHLGLRRLLPKAIESRLLRLRITLLASARQPNAQSEKEEDAATASIPS